MFELLDDAILLFEPPDVVVGLSPTRQLAGLRQPGAVFNCFANGIEEKVDVGRIMHIGFNHKGVAAGAKRLGGGNMMFNLFRRLNLG